MNMRMYVLYMYAFRVVSTFNRFERLGKPGGNLMWCVEKHVSIILNSP